MIPGEVVVDFNFRFCTESTAESLKQRVQAVLDRHALEYDLTWTLGGQPFLTTPGDLVAAAQQAIRCRNRADHRAVHHAAAPAMAASSPRSAPR